MVEQSHYGDLSLLVGVDEFSEMRPIVLLIGMSKVRSMEAARALIDSLSTSSGKGSLLTRKLAALFDRHLKFVSWFQQQQQQQQQPPPK